MRLTLRTQFNGGLSPIPLGRSGVPSGRRTSASAAFRAVVTRTAPAASCWQRAGRLGAPYDLRRRQVLDLAIDYDNCVTVGVSLLELLEILPGRNCTPAAVRVALNSHSHAASL